MRSVTKEIRRGKLNSQFIVTARISFSIFTKNFEFQSLLPWITPLAIEGVVQGQCDHIPCRVVQLNMPLSNSPATTTA